MRMLAGVDGRVLILGATAVLVLAFIFAVIAIRTWPPARGLYAEVRGRAGAQLTEAQTTARLERLAAGPGRMGIYARHLGNGRSIGLNEGVGFPLASTYKVAIVAAYLAAVENGQLSLEQMFVIDDASRIRSDGIAEVLPHPGVSLSAANLIELAIARSDNTASDLLLKAVGGPVAVTAWLQQRGITDHRIDRNTAWLLLDNKGIEVAPDASPTLTLASHVPLDPKEKVWWPMNPAFDRDPRDTGTPRAMVDLLASLERGKLLNSEHTALLLGAMSRTRTGPGRVRSGRPAGTPFAHKTGSLGGIAADVGIVTLPDGSRLALAVYVVGDPSGPLRDRRIATAGRALYQHFAQRE